MFGRDKDSGVSPEHSMASEKEWRLIEKVVLANTAELKRQRRWGTVFKLLTFVYLFALLWVFVANRDLSGSLIPEKTGGHTAIVQVRGLIADGEMASADAIYGALQAALQHKDTRAVILRINSGGGSPVQASYVFNEIRRQRELHPDIPITAVITDTGASGAYYIAAAADNIYANGASLVGSIGVTAASFGFQELLEKVGIERRQFIAGEHKSFLDPFQPLDPEEAALFEVLLANVHDQFVADVKAGRGDRLSTTEDKLFSGLIWTGHQALELGLVDGLKSTSELARELGYPRTVNFTRQPSPWERFARNLGVGIAQTLVQLGVMDEWQLR